MNVDTMVDFNQEGHTEQKAGSFIEITKSAAKEAVRLYFQPLLHPREALNDLLGMSRRENEGDVGRGTERR